MAKRSNVLVVLGVALFFLGAAIVFLLLRDDDASSVRAGSPGPGVGDESQLTPSSLPPGQAGGTSVVVPEGKQAVAVQLDFVPGVAGHVGAGDRVNMYSVVRNGQPDPDNPDDGPCNPRVHLFLSNIEVLEASAKLVPQEQSGAAPVTYLLALDPVEAERVIFLASNEALHLALAGQDVPPMSTPGPGQCSPYVDQVGV